MADKHAKRYASKPSLPYACADVLAYVLVIPIAHYVYACLTKTSLPPGKKRNSGNGKGTRKRSFWKMLAT